MLKKILFITVKFFILWITGTVLTKGGIFFWGVIENNININSSSKYQKITDYLLEFSMLVLFFICVGFLIKIKVPPKRIIPYCLRWGILFSIFPALTIGPYIFQTLLSFINTMYIFLLFIFTGAFIGYLDLKYKMKLNNEE